MLLVKAIPQLCAFVGIVLLLVRGFAVRRAVLAAAAAAGFTAGMVAALSLFASYGAEFSFAAVRDVVGGAFLLFWGTAVAAIYRSTGHDLPMEWWDRLLERPAAAVVSSLVAGGAAGAVAACRVNGADSATLLALLVLACALCALACLVDRALPHPLAASLAGLMAAVVALLLFSSSTLTRLDLFSPLTMKVMKFTHDFVHQFFESMLIPDHLFIKSYLWGYIGLLFGKEVGFWGGLAILIIPVALVLLSINLERLPSVAHIRQGAQRRRILANALGLRRRRLAIPALAALLLAAAVYKSLYPSVEYWDPKPVAVTANAAGEIFIPKKGEVELEDGKLHKFSYKSGGKEARFFLLVTPDGKMTAALDACAICKPDGYGQAEGAVICYYCKTLIPLETVGKPGGCNPVPIPCKAAADGVRLDGLNLVNTWGSTVQSTSGGKGGGK